ncbi:unnamed protein product [Sphagnum tenellum]
MWANRSSLFPSSAAASYLTGACAGCESKVVLLDRSERGRARPPAPGAAVLETWAGCESRSSSKASPGFGPSARCLASQALPPPRSASIPVLGANLVESARSSP